MKNYIKLNPVSFVNGNITLPGSKSISNRVLLIASMACGKTRIKNLLNSMDIKYMLLALKKIGIKYKINYKKKSCEIEGIGGPLQINSKEPIFLGNAGTAIRPLTAVLSLANKNDIVLTGDERMKERPINHLVDSLKQTGSNIKYCSKLNYPPIHIKGGYLGGNITIDGSISSQFLTSLLISSPMAVNDTKISVIGNLVSKPYIDITINIMKKFGVEVINNSYKKFYVYGNQRYKANNNFLIEGDASSASYFLSAAAIKGGTVKVYGLGKNSIQGDLDFVKVLRKMGAKIEISENYVSCTKKKLNGIDMDMNHIPDAAMTIATTALFADGVTKIRNIYNWRVKETDRLSAMSNELKKTGASIKEKKDSIFIYPPVNFRSSIINTYNDHRMAMCFSLLSLSKKNVTINNPQCTNKTFPEYFNIFGQICHYF
ncbi:3-phosphoshikimate 1-carboxyvinyltransferase [Buchnera aphidicola (Taiwanaphis decaspermi)]|uniref:3-phosphoshikimate 1-carboxyvinyltransferase n=1 Tax=Buchnera aphidicola TaxID=9 RepID=UPI0031B818E8